LAKMTPGFGKLHKHQDVFSSRKIWISRISAVSLLVLITDCYSCVYGTPVGMHQWNESEHSFRLSV
jgi:hypothetical protein